MALEISVVCSGMSKKYEMGLTYHRGLSGHAHMLEIMKTGAILEYFY